MRSWAFMAGLLIFHAVGHYLRTLLSVLYDLAHLVVLAARPGAPSRPRTFFLRKQLALFQERKVKPRGANDSARWTMATLSRMFPWRDALVNVQPDTFIRWPRKGFRLFWRWKSKPAGRPRWPQDLRELIRAMASQNGSWGEERIANELIIRRGQRR